MRRSGPAWAAKEPPDPQEKENKENWGGSKLGGGTKGWRKSKDKGKRERKRQRVETREKKKKVVGGRKKGDRAGRKRKIGGTLIARKARPRG